MIDIESELFDIFSTALRGNFSDITVYGEDVSTPADFPCVTIVEADNSVLSKTQDSDGLENHATLMYEVNVYSNKPNAKKKECKKIYKFIDELFAEYGFSRISSKPQTMSNSTIYRMIGRYTGVVSKDFKIFRR